MTIEYIGDGVLQFTPNGLSMPEPIIKIEEEIRTPSDLVRYLYHFIYGGESPDGIFDFLVEVFDTVPELQEYRSQW